MMKRSILLLIFFAVQAISFAQTTPVVKWPANYCVFQRNTTTTAGSTTVYFAGQVFDKTTITYRIETLSNTGAFVSDWKAWQAIPAGSTQTMGTSISTPFYFSLSVPTGWYRFTIKDGVSRTQTVKFGVGEVFVIAGQSNAKGNDPIEYISGLTDLDCVVSCKNYIADDLTLYKNMEAPIFGVLNSTNKNIGPRGNRPWFYQSLGNQISAKEAGQVIPVCFFNVAHGGSSIDNWNDSMLRTKTMFSSNYGNAMTVGSTTLTTNPFSKASPWDYSFDNRFPYVDLKNILSFYGSMFGVRAVIWHQGEAETRSLLSQNSTLNALYGAKYLPASYNINNYDTKLNAIITDTRSILPNLPWAISKVSLLADTKSGTFQPNIVNNSTNITWPGSTTYPVGGGVIQEQVSVSATSNVSWASQNSDSYVYSTSGGSRVSDGTHFNMTGLTSMASDVYSNITSIISKSPVLPLAPPKMTLATRWDDRYYTISATGFSGYFWQVYPTGFTYDQTTPPGSSSYQSGTPATGGGGPDSGYSGYAKTSSGRVSLVVPNIRLQGVSGARKSEENSDDVESKVYPNPLLDGKDLQIKFTLTQASPVSLRLIGENGITIEQINKQMMEAGDYHFSFPVQSLHNGVRISSVIYKLRTNEHNETRKVLLVK